MTDRLESAISKLSPSDVELLTKWAESLAAARSSGAAKRGELAQLTWVGALKSGPYRSGLEAQEAAKRQRIVRSERTSG